MSNICIQTQCESTYCIGRGRIVVILIVSNGNLVYVSIRLPFDITLKPSLNLGCEIGLSYLDKVDAVLGAESLDEFHIHCLITVVG